MKKKSFGHLEKTPPPGHSWTRAPAPMLELPQSERGGNGEKNERILSDALYIKTGVLCFKTVMNFNQNHC